MKVCVYKSRLAGRIGHFICEEDMHFGSPKQQPRLFDGAKRLSKSPRVPGLTGTPSPFVRKLTTQTNPFFVSLIPCYHYLIYATVGSSCFLSIARMACAGELPEPLSNSVMTPLMYLSRVLSKSSLNDSAEFRSGSISL